MCYSFVVTFIILKVLDVTMGLRVSEEEELAGVDASQHGERAYQLEPGGAYAGIPIMQTNGTPYVAPSTTSASEARS
jgi:Amt family ammonium transporter